MLISHCRQLFSLALLIATFGSGPAAWAKNSEKAYEHWKAMQLERAKKVNASLSDQLQGGAGDAEQLANYRQYALEKLAKLSQEELGSSETHGPCHLNLPRFAQMFESTRHNSLAKGSSAENAWELAQIAAEGYWEKFSAWHKQDGYQKDLNLILKKLKGEQKKLISKKKWLQRIDLPIGPYLHQYSQNKLQKLKQKKAKEFFQVRLIKDLGRLDLNEDSEELDQFMKRLQRWLGGISLFLQETGIEPSDKSMEELFKLSLEAEKPFYFQVEKNIEEFTWIEEKIKYAAEVIPDPILLDGGLQKVIRVMLAHTVFALNSLDESLSESEIDRVIFRALQSGYYYGLTYPLIDDLSDSNRYLDERLRARMESLILKGLAGERIDPNIIPEHPVAQAILHIFDDLQKLYPRSSNGFLWDSLYVLFQAQIEDRKNVGSSYSDQEVYLPIILKSAFSRIISAAFTQNLSKGFIENAFATALISQFTDDLKDQDHDEKHGQFTPFTWSPEHQDDADNQNPYQLYLASLAYLNSVHGKESGASEASMQRMIMALSSLYKKLGAEGFKAHLAKYELADSNTERYLTKLAKRHTNPEDPEASLNKKLKNLGLKLKERKALKSFQAYMQQNRPFIEQVLPVQAEADLPEKGKLADAMNYSLQAGGKRIRPLLALMTGSFYGIERERLAPLLRSLEYLHTASLILDDLPAQDNAPLRRGKPTNHIVYGEATAQLASVSLISLAFGQMIQLENFDDDLVREVTQYAAEAIGHNGLSAGQMMDLQGQVESIDSVEQLKNLSHLKTGLAIEAGIWPVARLAEAPEEDLMLWKSFARKLGLLFQIRDDILDVEGDQQLLGKVAGTDEANNASTFVSLLGLKGAYDLLADTWLSAKRDLESLEEAGRSTELFKGVLDFIFLRDH